MSIVMGFESILVDGLAFAKSEVIADGTLLFGAAPTFIKDGVCIVCINDTNYGQPKLIWSFTVNLHNGVVNAIYVKSDRLFVVITHNKINIENQVTVGMSIVMVDLRHSENLKPVFNVFDTDVNYDYFS